MLKGLTAYPKGGVMGSSQTPPSFVLRGVANLRSMDLLIVKDTNGRFEALIVGKDDAEVRACRCKHPTICVPKPGVSMCAGCLSCL